MNDSTSSDEGGGPVRLTDLRSERAKRVAAAQDDALNWPAAQTRQALQATTGRGSLFDEEELAVKGGAGGRSQLAESRQRLSRLLDREKLLRSKGAPSSSSSSSSSSHAAAERTVSFQSPMKARQAMKESRQLITRSLSPSPRKRTQPPPPSLTRLGLGEFDGLDTATASATGSSSSARTVDSPAIQEIAEFMSLQTQRVLRAESVGAIRELCSLAQTDLSPLCVSQVQLWMNRGGFLEAVSSNQDTGAVTITIAPHTAAQLAGERHNFGRGGNAGAQSEAVLAADDDMILTVAASRTIHQDDAIWEEVERAMRLVAGPGSDSRTWHSIHAISTPCSESMLAGQAPLCGVLLIAEAFAPSVPVVAMLPRLYRNGAAQLKTRYLVESSEKLAMAISYRFHQLQAWAARVRLQEQRDREMQVSRRHALLESSQRAVDAAQDAERVATVVTQLACGLVEIAAAPSLCPSQAWVLLADGGAAGTGGGGSDDVRLFSCRLSVDENGESRIEVVSHAVPVQASGLVGRILGSASGSAAFLSTTVEHLENAGLLQIPGPEFDCGWTGSTALSFLSVPAGGSSSAAQTSAYLPSRKAVIVLAAPSSVGSGNNDDTSSPSATSTWLQAQTVAAAEFASRSFAAVADRQTASMSNSLQSVPSILWGSLANSGNSASTGAFHQFCRQFDSESISRCFHAKRCALLISSSVASSLDLCPAPLPRSISFWHAGAVGFYEVLAEPLAVSVLPWMQDLQAGKPVVFAAPLVDELASDSAVALATLVQGVQGCSSASSAVLLPVKTPQGLCIVVAVDKIGGAASAQDVGTRLPRPSQLALALAAGLERSQVSADVAAAVSTALRLQGAEQVTKECVRREDQLEGLGALLESQRRKAQAMLHFSKWKHSLEREKGQAAQTLLNSALSLLALPEPSDRAERSSIKAFLTAVESQVSQRFPNDSISVAPGLLPGMGAIPSDVHALLMTAEAQGAAVVYEPVRSRDFDASVLDTQTGARTVLVGFVRVAVPATGNEQSLGASKVIGTIRVMRTGGFRATQFSALSGLCHAASVIYSALRRGAYAPQGEGDVRGLLLPLLRRTLPFLLEGPRRDPETLRALMPSLAQLLKLLCGAEVALLRLTATESATSSSHDVGSGGGGGSSSRSQPFTTRELLVSSEDCPLQTPSAFMDAFSDDLAAHGLHSSSSVSFAAANSPPRDSSALQPLADTSRYAQLLIRLREPSDDSTLGELKVLGPQHADGFDADHQAAAELVGFILSHAMGTAKRFSRSDESLLGARNLMKRLEAALDERGKELIVERGAASALRARLSASLALSLCMRQIAESSSTSQLALCVSEAVPLVVGSRSAVLLLSRDAIGSDTDGDEPLEKQSGLHVLMPSAATPGSSSSSASDMPAFITFTELAALPAYLENPSASQSKILLFAEPNAPYPFGALLLFGRRETSGEAPSDDVNAVPNIDDPWGGLGDVLLTGLAGAVQLGLQTAAQAKLRSKQAQSQARIEVLEHTVSQIAPLEARRSALQERVNFVEGQLADRDGALRDAELMREHLERAHAQAVEELRATLTDLEVDKITVEKARMGVCATRDALFSLIEGFSFDHSAHRETVPNWLHHYANLRDAVMVMVAQAEDGTLSSGGLVEEIRGVTGAAGEALRTGAPIVVQSSVLAASSLLRRWPTVWRSSDDSAASAGHGLVPGIARFAQCSVLCVPNRCISLDTKCDHACFVFLRPLSPLDTSPSFSDHDKALLVSASSLASRLMLRDTSRYSVDDLRTMELEIQKERALVYKVRHAVLASEALVRRSCSTLAEAAREIEASVVDLLWRGEGDSCAVVCQCLLLPENTTTHSLAQIGQPAQLFLASKGLTLQEAELVQRACSTSKGVRLSSTLWTALKGTGGTVLAILRVERRLTTDVPIADVPVDSSWPSSHQARFTNVSSSDSSHALSRAASSAASAPTLADLLITDEEEEAVGIFSRQSAGHLVRIRQSVEAAEGLETASRAMKLLQGSLSELEKRLEGEVQQRSGLEQTLRAGIELLGACCAKRFSVEQLLDTARRSILSITASDECYIVLPRILEVFPQPQSVGEVVPDGFYTIETDRPSPLRVRFDPSDMEFAAMQSSRICVAPSEGLAGAEMGVAQAQAQLANSWTARRYLGQLALVTDVSTAQALQLQAVAVPFSLQQGTLAVLSALRRGVSPFSSADKESISWISRVLAYCLEMWAGKGSIREAESRASLMEREIARLRILEERLRGLQGEVGGLQQDLLASPVAGAMDGSASDLESAIAAISDPSHSARTEQAITAPRDPQSTTTHSLVLSSARLVFTGLTISCQSAAEAGQSVGELLPWESADVPLGGGGPAAAAALAAVGLDADTSRGIVESVAGKATYWVGKRGGQPTLVALINHRGFSPTWLNVTIGSSVDGAGNGLVGMLGTRVALLLRLLDAQEGWFTHHVRLLSDNSRLHAALESRTAEAAGAVAAGRGAVQTVALAFSASGEVSRTASDFALGRGGAVELHDGFRVMATAMGRQVEAMGFEVAVGVVAPFDSGAESSAPYTASAAAAKITWFVLQEGSPWTLAGSDLIPVTTALQQTSNGDGTQTAAVVVGCAEGSSGGSLSSEASNVVLRDAVGLAGSLTGPVGLHLLHHQSAFYSPGSVVVALPATPSSRSPLVLLFRSLPFSLSLQARPSSPQPNAPLGLGLDATLCAARIVSLLGIAASFRNSISIAEQCRSSIQASRRLAITRALASRSAILRAQSFATLKEHSLQQRLGAAVAAVEDFDAAKRKLRTQEQALADWAEMARGLNGCLAGGVIHEGVAGLWARCCRILASMVSSHVTLRVCGLCVENAAGDVVELSLRGPGASPGPRSASRLDAQSEWGINQASPDYRGAGAAGRDRGSGSLAAASELEVRPVSDLGGEVAGLASELLQVGAFRGFDSSARGAGFARLHKLRGGGGGGGGDFGSGGSVMDEGDAQTWMVPVRTARNVLAVVRLCVVVPSDRRGASASASASVASTPVQQPSPTRIRFADASTPAADGAAAFGVSSVRSFGSAAPGTVLSAASTWATDDTSSSPSSRLEAAQQTALNFCEMLAPLVSAAVGMDQARVSASQQEDEMRAAAARAGSLSEECALAAKGTAVLAAAQSVLSDLALSWGLTRSGSTDSASSSSSSSPDKLAGLVREVCDSLQAVLLGSVSLSLNERSPLGGGPLDYSTSRELHSRGAAVSEALCAANGDIVGRIVVSVSGSGSGSGSSSEQASEGGSGSGSSGLNSAARLVASVLRPLAKSVVTLLTMARHASSLASQLTAEAARANAAEAVGAAQHRELVLSNGVKTVFRRSIESLGGDVLAPASGIQIHTGAAAGAQELFRALAPALPGLLGLSAATTHCNLALVRDVLRPAGGVAVVVGAGGDGESKDASNVEGEGWMPPPPASLVFTSPGWAGLHDVAIDWSWQEAQPAAAAAGPSVASALAAAAPATVPSLWSSLNESSREIVENLARACVLRRLKSSVDVCDNSFHQASEPGPSSVPDAASASTSASATATTASAAAAEGAAAGDRKVRVLSYPLVFSLGPSGACIGVLQVLVSDSPGQPQPQPGDAIDSFCEQAASALATAAGNEHFRRACAQALERATVCLEQARQRGAAAEAAFAVAVRRSEAWRDAAGLGARAVAAVAEGRALAEMVSAELAGRRASGLSVALRMQAAGALLSAPQQDGSGSNVVTALVPLDAPGSVPSAAGGESGALCAFAEVSHDVDSDPAAATGAAAVSAELVASISAALRTAAQFSAQAQAQQRLLLEARQAAADASDSAAQQQSSYLQAERLRQTSISSLSAFCGPTIREISILLEDIGSGRRLQVETATERDARRMRDAASASTVGGARGRASSEEDFAEEEKTTPSGDDGAGAGAGGMHWAWDSLARVADRALARISDRSFNYHASLLVRESPPTKTILTTRARPADEGKDLRVRMYDASRRREVLTIANNRGAKSVRLGVLSDANVCTLEKALLTGGVHEVNNSQSQTDLIGIDRQTMASLFDDADPAARVHVLCVGLPDAPGDLVAVLRLVFPSEVPAFAGGGGGAQGSYSRQLVRPIMEMVMSLGCAVVHISRHLSANALQVQAATAAQSRAGREREEAAGELARARRMHRVVCREACTLLDPPLVGPGGHAPRAVHPASLTPLAASQDSCTKLLNISRSLLQGEGQALLLRDPTTEPISFQVIFSGNALGWAGVEQGSFGLVGSASQNSLAEACMHSHKTVTVADGPCDPRYNALVDGSCAAGSPMLFVPVRGRGSAVIGCLLLARARGAAGFSAEDVAAAEMVASHGALTLYWCQGLGTLHHLLTKNVTKMEELERAVSTLTSAGLPSGVGVGMGGAGGRERERERTTRR